MATSRETISKVKDILRKLDSHRDDVRAQTTDDGTPGEEARGSMAAKPLRAKAKPVRWPTDD